MADKTPKKTGFSLQGFDANHIRQTEGYVQAIDNLYNIAISEFAKVAGGLNFNPDKVFSFADYPQARNAAQQIVKQLAAKMQAVIVKGSREQWLYACKKNDEFLKSILKTTKIKKSVLNKYQDRNMEALDTFQKRKINGLDLSQRVWNYAGQMKTQMELGIDIALGEGKSAQALSKDLKQYLVDPDKLFRRVSDKHGKLVLSKNAKAFHPGQGKYRSSYKNSMRLTRTEINMAYRESDQLRWQQLDFVVGYEVKLSNNHTTLINGVPTPFKDICDELVGKYPKSFVFKGWHPQCRCVSTPILQDRDEFNDDELSELRAALKGSEYKKLESRNKVTDVPDNFKQWVSDNAERSQNWKSQPYFIRENFKGGTIAGGLKFGTQPIINKPIQAPKAEPKTEPAAVKAVPIQFQAGSGYFKDKSQQASNEFFALIDPNKPLSVEVRARGGAHYDPSKKLVVIGSADRRAKSQWFAEKILYHEYGHAIDWQRSLRYSPEVKQIMDNARTSLRTREMYTRRVREYSYAEGKIKTVTKTESMTKIAIISDKLSNISYRIMRMPESVFTKRGLTKSDVMEAFNSTADAVMSLNSSYGWGHTKSYFSKPGMKEAEFLAHAFENAFGGNPVFKKYLPELYDETVKYIKSLK
jgi:hypothetical protein